MRTDANEAKTVNVAEAVLTIVYVYKSAAFCTPAVGAPFSHFVVTPVVVPST